MSNNKQSIKLYIEKNKSYERNKFETRNKGSEM
jgi:hypothetical protein